MSKPETMMIDKIKDEKSVHSVLRSVGFETNYNKSLKEIGYDIIALKDGESFLIEHKVCEKRENGTYRFNGEIKGDVCMVSSESGFPVFVIYEKTSLTKTMRLVDIIYGNTETDKQFPTKGLRNETP